jgi:hypothetical protein
VLRFQNPISKFQTLISTFRRYRRFSGNHCIEYGYVDIEVTVFDIEKNVDIVIFDIDVNVDIGGGKVPDAGARGACQRALRARAAAAPPGDSESPGPGSDRRDSVGSEPDSESAA